MDTHNKHTPRLSPFPQNDLVQILKQRFEKHMHRHLKLEWADILDKLDVDSPAGRKRLWSLGEMERTGGEPDVVGIDGKTSEYFFIDCARESPAGRRSLCYDRTALNLRKEHKPDNSALDMAATMGIELLTEDQYRQLQKLETFDTKTSSWLTTPPEIRKLGGAIFADFRYNHVFVYHNGADSYYASRGFRGLLRI